MIACLRLPHFAAATHARLYPEPAREPFLLFDEDYAPGLVYAASTEAAGAGLRAGMKCSEARALCPQALEIPTRHAWQQRAFEGLLASLAAFSERLEGEWEQTGISAARIRRGAPPRFQPPLEGAALVYLDLGRLRVEEGFEIAAHLQRAMLEAQREVALGLATGPFPARVAALAAAPRETLLVSPAQSAAFLAPFPSELLPIDGETLRQLELLGLRRLGQIAALPRTALTDRFGRLGPLMHDLANGIDRAKVAPYLAPRLEQSSVLMEGGVLERRMVEAALDQIAADLAGKLEAGQRVTRDLCLRLRFEGGGQAEADLVLRAPAWSASDLRTALGELLGRLRVGEAIVEVQATASGIAPLLPRQLGLFEREALDEQALHRLLLNLARRYGDEKFFWLRPGDPHTGLPERRYRWEGIEGS